MPAPEGWDRKKAYKFLTDLEDAAWKVYDKQAQAAIKGDPDKEFLEFLGNQFTSMIEPNDLEGIKWKEYKKYIPTLSFLTKKLRLGTYDIKNDYTKNSETSNLLGCLMSNAVLSTPLNLL